MIVVSDTSSVSALLRIGQGELLQKLYGEVLIPEAVQRELLIYFPALPVFLSCRPVKNSAAVRRFCMELDLGEAEALVLAREAGADFLLMDESLGREVAVREGIALIGLLGVLVQAKRAGLLDSVSGLIHRIETEANFRVSVALRESILKQANEL